MNAVEKLFFRDHISLGTEIKDPSSSAYIGMSTRHLSTRLGEHLGFQLKTESSVKEHIMSCDICSNSKFNVNSFKIIKKCNSNFETKIHEALLIKKHNPKLNRQLFANGSSFLLNIFQIILCQLDVLGVSALLLSFWRLHFKLKLISFMRKKRVREKRFVEQLRNSDH